MFLFKSNSFMAQSQGKGTTLKLTDKDVRKHFSNRYYVQK